MSTVPARPSERSLLRGRAGRRLALSVIGLFVLAAAAGLLGVRTERVATEGGGYRLEVEYQAVSRAGLNTPLRVIVARAEPFDGPITIGISHDYLDLFDINAFTPSEAKATSSAGMALYEFDPPLGNQLEVFLDARLAPNVQAGRSGRVSVWEDETEVVAVDFSTWVPP